MQVERRRRLAIFIVLGLVIALVLIILLMFITLLPGLKGMWQGHN